MDRVAWAFNDKQKLEENFKVGADLAAEDEKSANEIYEATLKSLKA